MELHVADDEADPQWVRWWACDPRPSGQPVRYGPSVHTMDELLEVVSSGAAIAITGGSVADSFRHPGVAFVPIVDIAPCPISLCTRLDDLSPLVAALRRAVQVIAAESKQRGRHPVGVIDPDGLLSWPLKPTVNQPAISVLDHVIWTTPRWLAPAPTVRRPPWAATITSSPPCSPAWRSRSRNIDNPHHRAILKNYRMHGLLEVAGRYEDLLAPDKTVEEPHAARLHEGGQSLILDGMDQVRGFSSPWPRPTPWSCGSPSRTWRSTTTASPGRPSSRPSCRPPCWARARSATSRPVRTTRCTCSPAPSPSSGPTTSGHA